MLLGMELLNCPGLMVPAEVMHHVVNVESSYNPYAIGVVGGRLVRQPKTLQEAVATARMLESRGYNFSLGLAQVNRYNLTRYGLDSYEKAFEVCPNLQAGSRILAECHQRSGDWGKSFSCYYSGNFITGFKHGYVQKIFASMNKAASANSGTAIELAGQGSARRGTPAAMASLNMPVMKPAVPAQMSRRSSVVAQPAMPPVQEPVSQPAMGVAVPTESKPAAQPQSTQVDNAFVF